MTYEILHCSIFRQNTTWTT